MIVQYRFGEIIMDLIAQNKTEIDRLVQLYLISNTPNFLYRKFREDYFVKNLAERPFDELKTTFLDVGRKGISKVDELVLAYALYISMTFKDYREVSFFYKEEGNINFEWFSDIKNIFLSSNNPSQQISFDVSDFTTTLPTMNYNIETNYNKEQIQIMQNNSSPISEITISKNL